MTVSGRTSGKRQHLTRALNDTQDPTKQKGIARAKALRYDRAGTYKDGDIDGA